MDKSQIIEKLLNGEMKLYQIEKYTDSIDEAVDVRREFIEKYTSTSLENVSHYTLDMDMYLRRILKIQLEQSNYLLVWQDHY